MYTKLKKISSCLLIIAIISLSLPASPAQAGMITTADIMQEAGTQEGKQRLLTLLDRADVQKQLVRMDVDPMQAKARVASMTDEEVQLLNEKLNELPVGEGALTTLITAVLVVFLVLLITDIMGVTDVFPFVKK